ncbi:MAG: divalent-cation tolerance protein CutA [Nanoarchaeota archaeon]
MIIIYVTYPNKEEAQRITEHLLNKRLIACANTFPIKSSYFWKGGIEHSNEFVSVIKTKKENWETVKKEIKKLHSYDLPCILKLDVEADEEYGKWVKEETK